MSSQSICRVSASGLSVSVSQEIWLATDWRELWRSITKTGRDWRTLAVVPGGPGAAAWTSLQIAAALAQTGSSFLRTGVHLANATELQPNLVPEFWSELHYHLGDSARMVIALSALASNASSLPLAKGSDGALLCIVLGQISTPEAKQTLKEVGAGRFIGSAVFHLRGAATKKPTRP